MEVHSAAMRAAAGTLPPFPLKFSFFHNLPLLPSLFLPVVACQLVAGAVLLAPVAADPAPMAAYPVPPGSLEPAPCRLAWGRLRPGRPEGHGYRGSPRLRAAGALRRLRPRPGGRWGAAAAAPAAARCWDASAAAPAWRDGAHGRAVIGAQGGLWLVAACLPFLTVRPPPLRKFLSRFP